MKIIYINESRKKDWDDFCSNSENNPILQSYEWGELKSNFGWQVIRIAIEEDGKIIAGASILKRKLPLFNNSIFYIPRGPVVNYKSDEILKMLFEAIKNEAQKHRAVVIKIDPPINERDMGAVVALKNLGFRKVKKQIQPRSTLMINLELSLDDLMNSFEEKTRYNIRLSLRKGVVVKPMPTEEGVKIFYQIYKQTAQRDIFMIHPLEYYLKLYQLFISKGMGAIFIAYYNDEPIAGIFNFCFGSKVWYMYGASGPKYRNYMPNHALHWEFIKWAKELNYKTYDLWGIPSNPQPDHPLWGVYRFKKGFSKELIKWIGACDLVLQPIMYQLLDKGMNFVKSVRSLIIKGKISDSLGE